MQDEQKTESIRDLIYAIDKKDIYLPEFQRDFVWDLTRTYDLFDSLVQDIFIGPIIYGKPLFAITVREFDDRPRTGSDSKRKIERYELTKSKIDQYTLTRNIRLVLDGQQRITSLFRSLKGIDKVYFIVDEQTKTPPLKIENLSSVFGCISGKENDNQLSIRFDFVWNVMNDKFRRESEKIEIFHNTQYFKKVVNSFPPDKIKKWEDFFLLLVDKLSDLLKSEKLLTYYLLNTDTKRFTLFFERSNSRAIPLSFIDILSAKIFHGFNLRKKNEEFDDTNPSISLDTDMIIRVMAFHHSNGSDISKSYILNNLTADLFNEKWDELTGLYKTTVTWLIDNFYFVSLDWLPYQTLLLGCMLFVNSLPSKVFSSMTTSQLELFNLWYWSSIFSQRYSQQSGDSILSDANVLTKIATDQLFLPDKSFFSKLRCSLENSDDLYIINKKGNAIYKGALCLINFSQKGYKDLNNGSNISFLSEKIDDHHIFPREYLKNKYSNDNLEYELIDSIANRMLIPKITNIKIGKKKPSKYLKEISDKNNALRNCLETHLIPTDIVDGKYDDNYIDFIDKRSSQIYELILLHTDKVRDKYMKLVND